MRARHLLLCFALTFFTASCCPLAHAQSVADAARAAKEKKQKQSPAAPSSDASPAKPKVITNDEIPEVHSDSQPASSKSASSSAAPKSASSSSSGSAATGDQAPQDGLPHGPDSVHVDFKFTTSRVKRPGTGETLWMVKNTSDHFERMTLKTIITGPCKYHRENDGALEPIPPGGGETDNMQVNFFAAPEDCPGTYRVELSATVAGKTTASASDTITVE
jgi:hypothetical protein